MNLLLCLRFGDCLLKRRSPSRLEFHDLFNKYHALRKIGTETLTRLVRKQRQLITRSQKTWQSVEKRPVFNRRSVQRICMLFDKDPNSARDIWSRMKQQREWFEIPARLKSDRTFARDPLECYYLERLDELFRTDRFDKARENPLLLQDPLFPRWWCAFRL